MRASLALAVLVVLVSTSLAAPSDLVTNLPGFGPLPQKTYGGYVTVNEQYGANLYYWFVESQNNPATDPVVLWLNGGPGCSSLFGAFVENGNLLIQRDGSLKANPHSWNRNASVLYVDSPVGTGFSYVKDPKGGPNNEIDIATDTYNLLSAFFFKLHPEYSNNKFYIFGESYAGKYIPWLAYTILQNNTHSANKINLSGIGVGDGLVAPYYQVPSYATFLYANNLINAVELGIADAVAVAFEGLLDIKSYEAAQAIDNALLNTLTTFAGNVDVYDIRYYNGDPTDPLQDALTTYLNRPEVQKAMNGAVSWGACNQAPYFRLLDDIARSSESLIPKILEQVPVLLYNGNKDLICNMIGTQKWSDAMPWKSQQQFLSAPVNKWTVGGQEAGNWKSAGGLTRLVVLNAGHMVPFSQPAFAYDMLTKFLSGFFH